MSFRVNKTISWQAGEGTPIKYEFSIDIEISIVSVSSGVATISAIGSCSVQNNPTNSRNSWAASDFAILATGENDPWSYPFSPNTSYYEAALPLVVGAPQSVLDGVLLQFRGDTWISDPIDNNNRSSLYYKPSGIVLNSYNGSTLQTFSVNTTFTVDISGGGDVPLLSWVASSADNSTTYDWMEHQVWASLFDLDYRPGATLDTNINVWRSHNRINGACHILPNTTGDNWHECRTIGGDIGSQGNPPLILHSSNANSWYNQKRIGKIS